MLATICILVTLLCGFVAGYSGSVRNVKLAMVESVFFGMSMTVTNLVSVWVIVGCLIAPMIGAFVAPFVRQLMKGEQNCKGTIVGRTEHYLSVRLETGEVKRLYDANLRGENRSARLARREQLADGTEVTVIRSNKSLMVSERGLSEEVTK